MKNVVINLYTSSYITRLFFLAILACPTILPENPFRAYTHEQLEIFPFSHFERNESCQQRFWHCRPLGLTSGRQRSASLVGLLG